MLKKNRLTLAVSAAIGLGSASFLSAAAQAQETDPMLEEVVVTGSMIKRVDLDNALPVQVLNADEIARVGITNAGDLIEKVPAMQGFTTQSDQVGGSGGGIRTASLRGIGEEYTLTLLNGRRMAPATSGSAVDISNIPMAMIDRVEILTDGASALYGSDAIAGVVNFIMKDSVEETTISVRGDQPQEDGGESWNFDIVTGFGDLREDGFSVVASYSHEERDALAAVDRDFAETGMIHFAHDGQQLYFENSSANNIPGNAYVYDADWNYITGFNPYRKQNGDTCPTQTTPSGEFCRFDYTSTIEILPESERDTVYLTGKLNFTDNLTGFATAMVSKYETTNRIAPYPTGQVTLDPDSDLVRDNILSQLTPEQAAEAANFTGAWRALPASNRTTEYKVDSYNFTTGLEGSAGEIDYGAAVTHSITDIEQNYPTGWLLLDEFGEIAGSGAINIFAGQDSWTEEDQAALDPAVYSGPWDANKQTMTAIDAQAAMPVFEIGGGDIMAAVGVDYRTTNYDRSISRANANEELLFLSRDTEYELEREQWGVFTEVLFPVMDNLEFTASLRYDDVGAVEDKLNGGDIDEGDSDTTYKISGLWNVTDAIALRGSFGTGFKAPTMREIGEPRSDFGVTSGTFDCPFSAGDPRLSWCTKPGANQHNVYREGYAGLKFETSEQYTFGLVLTPWDNFDATVDYWNIELDNLVDRPTEQQIFDNPAQYDDLFTTKTNLSTGQEELAIIQATQNVASAEFAGIDWALNQGFDLGWGQLDLGLRGTYMVDQDNSLYGSSLGRFGSDDNVVFRNIANFSATLYHGNFTHTLLTNYRSGYTDQLVTAEITGTGVPLGQGPTTDVQLDIASYTTSDYQFRWSLLNDSLDLNFGIKNMFDKQPHLSLRESGAGHQVGWDPRYTDGYGRTYYLSASYAF